MTSERVLFVEDDPDDVFLLQRACRKAGMTFPARFLSNGERAVEFLLPIFENDEAQARPELIFLDLNMPEMDGFEFLKWLRGDARASSIPVAILSTSENPEDMHKAYAAGANAYLVKANTVDGLARTISAALRFWSTRAEAG